MILKDSNYLFESTKEAVDSQFTDEELEMMLGHHTMEVKSYQLMHDLNNAMQHAVQMQFIKEAIVEREITKPII